MRVLRGLVQKNILHHEAIERGERAADFVRVRVGLQQILALLLWQFRVLLFAVALERGQKNPGAKMPSPDDMAKAIRSSPGAILRWRTEARSSSQAEVIRAYESLYATDVAIKSGRVDSDAAAITLCVLDLCGVRGAGMEELVASIPLRW